MTQPFADNTFTGDAGSPGHELQALELWGATVLRQHRPGHPEATRVATRLRRAAAAAYPAPEPVEAISLPEPGADPIEEALKQSSQAYLLALRDAGLPVSALPLLQSWMELTMGARALQQRIEDERARQGAQAQGVPAFSPPAIHRDPIQPLTAVELGREMGNLSDETVRNYERLGRLFSILRPGRRRGREYPAFQAWPSVAGEPLARVLATLGAPKVADGADAYAFFTSKNDLLAALTPIEVLIGTVTAARELSPAAVVLLMASSADRLGAVEQAAEAYAAQVAA